MGLLLLTPPADYPITLTEAKRQCEIEPGETTWDAMLRVQIATATREAERVTGRQLVAARYRLTLDAFPEWEIYLPRPPLLSVASVAYTDTAEDAQTVASFETSEGEEPGFITPAYGAVWPTALDSTGSVQITFWAGYPVTSVAAAISSGSQVVTPGSMNGIAVGSILGIDEGASFERVTVTAVAATTFTATFASSHEAGARVNGVPEDLQAKMKCLIGAAYKNRDEDEWSLPHLADRLFASDWHGSYMMGAA